MTAWTGLPAPVAPAAPRHQSKEKQFSTKPVPGVKKVGTSAPAGRLRSNPLSAPRCLWGCTPESCKPYTRPASRPRKGPRVSYRDIHVSWMGELTRLKPGPGAATPLQTADSGQDAAAAAFAWGGGGKWPVIWGIDIRLAHWLPRKPTETHAPPRPLWWLSQWRSKD